MQQISNRGVAEIGDRVSDSAGRLANKAAGFGLAGTWLAECYDADGNLKWTDTIEANLVVNEGLTFILEKFFRGSAYTAANYVALMSGTPTVAAGDTMASHAGWTEVYTQYSETSRPTYNPGSAASQSINNSSSKAVFTFTGTVTVGGAALSTNSTKNGTTGTLISAGAFTEGNKSMANGDTLNVSITYNASAV